MKSRHGRWTCSLAGALLLGTSLSGCAGVWDDLTAKDKPFGTRVKGLFVKQDPLVVLRDSSDGDERAKALRALRDPLEQGGTDQDHEFVFELLTKAATTDKQPLCRLAAIQKLATFNDQRTAKILENAFYQVDDFTPDIATRIQCAALSAMGETGDPQVVPFLVEKLKEPPAERSDFAQQRNDRCIAAARALGHFKDYQATEALAQVLHREKEDVALKGRAHESLQLATGKDLPADYQAWDEFLHPKDQNTVARQHDRKIINLAGWFGGGTEDAGQQ